MRLGSIQPSNMLKQALHAPVGRTVDYLKRIQTILERYQTKWEDSVKNDEPSATVQPIVASAENEIASHQLTIKPKVVQPILNTNQNRTSQAIFQENPILQSHDLKHSNITYESLGIDPVIFYSGKFAGSPCRVNFLADPANRFDIEYSRARFLVKNIPSGGLVLDLGCGSGPFGQTLRDECQVKALIGVDMDPVCVRLAEQTYDQAEVFQIGEALPFPDATFDAVFSVDFFGHVEFRHKNRLIEEIHRVTKPGGISVHIIESMKLDYHKIQPGNIDDPRMKYIHMEGHVGIEPADIVSVRWLRCFQSVVVENAFLFPFYPSSTYAALTDTFEEPLRRLIEGFSPQEKRAANICLGFVCDFLMEQIRQRDPTLLLPDDSEELLFHHKEHEARSVEEQSPGNARDILRHGSGLIHLVARR